MLFVSILLSLSYAMNPDSNEEISECSIPAGGKKNSCFSVFLLERPMAQSSSLSANLSAALSSSEQALDRRPSQEEWDTFMNSKKENDFRDKLIFPTKNETLSIVYAWDRSLWLYLDADKYKNLDIKKGRFSLSSSGSERNFYESVLTHKREVSGKLLNTLGNIQNVDKNNLRKVFQNIELVKEFKVLISTQRVMNLKKYANFSPRWFKESGVINKTSSHQVGGSELASSQMGQAFVGGKEGEPRAKRARLQSEGELNNASQPQLPAHQRPKASSFLVPLDNLRSTVASGASINNRNASVCFTTPNSMVLSLPSIESLLPEMYVQVPREKFLKKASTVEGSHVIKNDLSASVKETPLTVNAKVVLPSLRSLDLNSL